MFGSFGLRLTDLKQAFDAEHEIPFMLLGDAVRDPVTYLAMGTNDAFDMAEDVIAHLQHLRSTSCDAFAFESKAVENFNNREEKLGPLLAVSNPRRRIVKAR